MGDFLSEPGWMALGGCASGFLWSVAAGDAKLSTAKGWGRALLSCAGSAVNAVTIYKVTDHFAQDKTLARDLTLSWFGAQAGAGFANWIGRRYKLDESTAFNLVAFPLNFAASPVLSTSGLLWAGIGEAASGFSAEVSLYGGMLVFNHKLCVHSAANSGAIGHCFTPRTDGKLPQHEKGHGVQVSILGDAGTIGILGVDFLIRTFTLQFKTLGDSPGLLTLEPWAVDYADSVGLPNTSPAFKLPAKK